jgi:hypothetical protein
MEQQITDGGRGLVDAYPSNEMNPKRCHWQSSGNAIMTTGLAGIGFTESARQYAIVDGETQRSNQSASALAEETNKRQADRVSTQSTERTTGIPTGKLPSFQ